jgi:hypothetical protein
METVRTSETSVDNHYTLQYIPEDKSEHHTRRRENLKSHIVQEYLEQYIHWIYVQYAQGLYQSRHCEAD